MLSLGLIGPWVTPREGTSGQRKGLGNSEAPIVRWGASEISNGLGWAFCAQSSATRVAGGVAKEGGLGPQPESVAPPPQCRLSGRPLCWSSRSCPLAAAQCRALTVSVASFLVLLLLPPTLFSATPRGPHRLLSLPSG